MEITALTVALLLLSQEPSNAGKSAVDAATAAVDASLDRLALGAHLAAGGTLTDEQWQRALLRSGAIRVRERWPAEVPFAVCMEMPAWLQRSEVRLYTEGHAAPVARASSGLIDCGNCAAAATMRWWYQELEPLPLGEQVVSFQVTVERFRPRSLGSLRRDAAAAVGPEPGVLWRGTVSFPVEVVPKIDDVLPVVRGAEIDAAVRRMLQVSVENEEWLRVDAELAPEFATTALSLELELFEGTTSRGIEKLWVADRPTFGGSLVQWKLPEENADLSSWSVHVRSDAAGALQSWSAVKRWEGEFVVPLKGVKRE